MLLPRIHHLRTVVVLATLVTSLSLMFFSTKSDHFQPPSNSVLPTTRHPMNPTTIKNQQQRHHVRIPAPSALHKTRHLFKNRSVTPEDIATTLVELNRTLQDHRRMLQDQVGNKSVVVPDEFWNVTHPKRLLIVTSWRSGSTFLGQMLSEHPGVYNHYEPLMHLGVQQIRPGDPRVQSVVQHLQDLLNCRYSNGDFLRKIHDSMQDMLSHNVGVWRSCLAGPNRTVCNHRIFLENACRQFPFVTMKLVRLRLNLTRQLMADDRHLRIVYLVRDPRATMHSRLSSVKWCAQSPDCIDPNRLCSDISSDLDSFHRLSTEFPNRLMLIQYEQLAKWPQMTMKSVFEFAGLFYTDWIGRKVERHTSTDENQPWSTVRKSAERVNLWRRQMNNKTVVAIESVCRNAMSRLGYIPLTSVSIYQKTSINHL